MPMIADEIRQQNETVLCAEEDGISENIVPHLSDDFVIIRASGVKQDRATCLDDIEVSKNRIDILCMRVI